MENGKPVPVIPPGQEAVFAFLADPASHGLTAAIERIDTQISALFLAGDLVFKLKRAVTLPFLDFATVEDRRRACEAELALNRRTAPTLYLGVIPLTREKDGTLAFAGAGEAVDWVVKMRRFDQDGLFDHLIAEGRLDDALLKELADTVAAFHEKAEIRTDRGGAAGLGKVVESNALCFERIPAGVVDPAKSRLLSEQSRALAARLAPLLDKRREQGLVRACHGDLHLGNICLIEGRPTLFDAIEFSEDFSVIDVLYDLGFLLMDLIARDRHDLANAVFNRYFDRRPDIEGLAALPLFLSLRAAIRAHVAAGAFALDRDGASRDKASRYLDLARGLLAPPPPRLLAVGGLSGSGKSRMARALAPDLGARPGAVVLRSDVIRKRLMGVSPETKLDLACYDKETSRRTYAALFELAGRALENGHAVVADAVFARDGERLAIEAVARKAGVPFQGLWLKTDARTMRQRVEERKNDASDATPAVVEAQLAFALGSLDWAEIDTSGPREESVETARGIMGL